MTSHGRPLTELEAGITSPHPLLLLSYLLYSFFPSTLTGSCYCKPCGLMCKIPITLYPWDLETWTDQIWTWQEALSSRFSFLTGVDFHLTGLGKQWLSQRVYTGWVPEGAGRGGTSQVGGVSIILHQGVDAVLMCGSNAATAHLYLNSIFWVYIWMSLIHQPAQTITLHYITLQLILHSSMQQWFL